MYTIVLLCVCGESYFHIFSFLADQVLIVFVIMLLNYKQEIKAIVSSCQLFRGQKLWEQC